MPMHSDKHKISQRKSEDGLHNTKHHQRICVCFLRHRRPMPYRDSRPRPIPPRRREQTPIAGPSMAHRWADRCVVCNTLDGDAAVSRGAVP